LKEKILYQNEIFFYIRPKYDLFIMSNIVQLFWFVYSIVMDCSYIISNGDVFVSPFEISILIKINKIFVCRISTTHFIIIRTIYIGFYLKKKNFALNSFLFVKRISFIYSNVKIRII